MKQHLTKVHDYKQEKGEKSRDVLNYKSLFFYLDEDIPYLQYPSKQQQQQQQQQQQLHVDESTSTNVVEVSAPLVVKLPGDEPLPPTSLVVSHPQPIVSGI
jgi:superfamily II DNA helicase RecQ